MNPNRLQTASVATVVSAFVGSLHATIMAGAKNGVRLMQNAIGDLSSFSAVESITV